MATALYSPIALASTVEYGETVDGVVLEKDIQLVYGTANNTKINPGGEQHIKEFGVSNNTEINGGYQYIEMVARQTRLPSIMVCYRFMAQRMIPRLKAGA